MEAAIFGLTIDLLEYEVVSHLDLPSILSLSWTCKEFNQLTGKETSYLQAYLHSNDIEHPAVELFRLCLRLQYQQLFSLFDKLFGRALKSIDDDSFLKIAAESLKHNDFEFFEAFYAKYSRTTLTTLHHWDTALEAAAASGSEDLLTKLAAKFKIDLQASWMYGRIIAGAASSGRFNILDWGERTHRWTSPTKAENRRPFLSWAIANGISH
jgi:hypothetical protein